MINNKVIVNQHLCILLFSLVFKVMYWAWVLRKAVNRKIDGLFLFTDNSSDSQGVAPYQSVI